MSRRVRRLAAVVVALATLLLLGCGGSSGLLRTLHWSDEFGAWSPDGRSIVFASDRSGEWDLYVVDADGRHLRRLTHGRAHEEHPVFLGKRRFLYGVLHESNGCVSSGNVEYLLSGDGRVRKRLARGVDESNVYVSPDQRWIAYSTSSSQELYLVRADGSGKRRITDGEAGAVSWSPDSKKLAFDAVLDQGSQVYLTAIPSGRIVQLSHLPGISSDPVWSPDGREIEFSRTGNNGSGRTENVLVRPDRSGLRVLTGGLGSGNVETWLPNGGRLLSDQTLLRSDGSVARRLKTSGAYVYPSPDGTRAAYEREGAPLVPNTCDPDVFGPAPRYERIDLVNLTTGESRALTQS